MKKLLVLFSLFFLISSCSQEGKSVESVKDIVINAHFSPRGGCTKAIISEIDNAKETIDVAIYSFTSKSILKALLRAHERGVKVRVVMDESGAKNRGSAYPYLVKYGIPVRVKRGTGGGLMHHKYAIIDGKVLITGSFNWTVSAERRNDENLLIIHSPELARVYKENFEKLWARSYSIH